jgi:transcriptional regulator GlxA family with amidase domain
MKCLFGGIMLKIGFLVYPGFSTMNFAVATVFETANQCSGSAGHEVELVSESGGPVANSLGSEIQTSSFQRRKFDTIVIAGGMKPPEATPGLLKYLRSAASRTCRIASICTGALVLAEAGLLEGKRATTHWHYTRILQRLHPKIHVEQDRIFTTDGLIWTSAGMSAGVDLALALVEQDFGAALARMVAKILVVYHRRAGGQSQFSTLLDLHATSDRIQTALAYARENLSARLSVQDLAAAAFLSPRQFSRLFTEETGQSPARAIERLRVEAAHLMMEAGRFSVEEIAHKNGFGNRERMRQSFIRTFGQPPQTMQRAVRA